MPHPPRTPHGVRGSTGWDGAPKGGIVVEQPGQPVGADQGIVDPQHRGDSVSPTLTAVSQGLLGQPNPRGGQVQTRVRGGQPRPSRCRDQRNDAFAKVHSASVFTHICTTNTEGPQLRRCCLAGYYQMVGNRLPGNTQ